ncbi:MAG TPA: folylpolyglutamate synthase/dihydrofolate synthase family protein [Pyrinomonadaceae bacterium]|nr:folylpolyglutamate synthase/dihydrofolate synthase family protein [Pyrinomonadaceae bacterium]
MNFAVSEQYLLSLGNEVSAMKLGLASMRRLLGELGDPQAKFLKIQIAGTNGKGSTCAFLDAMLRSAKLNVGLYTSPHLVSMTERIKVDGVDIDEREFARLATRVRRASEALVEREELDSVPTYFEQVTAIGLLAFAKAKVDVAILETGLGGRLDATTAADAEIAAITRIDLDHEKYLGRTLSKIAVEKAAIIRPHTQFAVLGEQTAKVRLQLARHCCEDDVRSIDAGATRVNVEKDGVEFTTQRATYRVKKLGLAGEHQIENAKVAIAVAENILSTFKNTRKNIESGLRVARNPGRLERIGRFLLDGAHNPSGIAALADHIRKHIDAPVTTIFAAMEDKNSRVMMREYFPLARTIVLTEAANSRSTPYQELLEKMPDGISKERTFATDNVASALQVALTADPEAVIVVAGSLYLVGEVRARLAP